MQDKDNKVARKNYIDPRSKTIYRYEKYYWNEGNIREVEFYNEKGKLTHRYLYTYDNKINYKKQDPSKISNPIHWGNNNELSMTWEDFNGTLDIACNPCLNSYKYNLDSYPVTKETNWGRKLTLSYQ